MLDLYYFCDDLELKRDIAKLFRFKAVSNGAPSADQMSDFYKSFQKKIKKLFPHIEVDYEFFSSVIFGKGTTPVVTCSKKEPGVITIIQEGQHGENAFKLIKLLVEIEPELEIVAEACNVNRQPYQYILLKKEKSLDIQSKNFELNPGFDNRDHLEIAVEAYSWLKKDISSVHQNISYKEDQLNNALSSLRKSLDKAPQRISKDFPVKIVDLLASYGIVDQNKIDFEEKEDCINSYLEKVLQKYASKVVIFYPELSGGWDRGQMVNEFASLITSFCKTANVVIENMTLVPPLDENGDESPYEEMNISFFHKGKKKEWSFSLETQYEYFEKFSKWASASVNGDYIWFNEDTYRGYLLPKSLQKDLYEIGVILDR